MRKIFFLIIMVVSLSAIALAQELPRLISPFSTNRSDKLVHCFTVKSDNEASAQSLAQKISQLMLERDLDIVYTPELDTLSDVVFYTTKADGNNLAKMYADSLQKMFYSGHRPKVSSVFKNETEGYVSYRIPSAVSLGNGRVLAFIEARSTHRDQAMNDLLVKISDDYGQSWGSSILVDDKGKTSLNNPCAIYIPQNDEVLLMYQSFPPATTEASTTLGYEGERVIRCYLTRSKDGGKSWSKAEDITRFVKHPDVSAFCGGPGVAILTDEGRIVVPFNASTTGNWYNYLVVSDDLGKTWQIVEGNSAYGTNESQVVQIDKERFLVNARSHRYIKDTSRTTPQGWSPWHFDRVTRNRANIEVTLNGTSSTWEMTKVMDNQPDPNCQGSILKLNDVPNRPILLCNPANQHTVLFPNKPFERTAPMRQNGTVRVSYDKAQTWKYAKRIYGDRMTEFQYSVLVDLGGGMIGVIFEASNVIKFARFDMEWLISGNTKE